MMEADGMRARDRRRLTPRSVDGFSRRLMFPTLARSGHIPAARCACALERGLSVDRQRVGQGDAVFICAVLRLAATPRGPRLTDAAFPGALR